MSWEDKGNIFDDAANTRFYLLNFKPNSASLSPGHAAFLTSEVKGWIEACDPNKKWAFGLVGGASATGSAAGNLALSQNRAKTVEQYLLQHVPALKNPHFKLGYGGVGMSNALKDDTSKLPPKQREEAQGIYRNVFCFLSELTQPPQPPPTNDQSEIDALKKARQFEIRQVEQISFSQGIGPGTAAIQLDAKVDFDIKDAVGRIARYTYTGVGVALGPSLSSLLKDKLRGQKWSELLLGVEGNAVKQILEQTLPQKLVDFLVNSTNLSKQIRKGPWQPFLNRGLSLRAVNNWAGEMQLTQYGVITNLPDLSITPEILKKISAATGNTILNFGGTDVVLPDMKPGYAAHVENFSSGDVTFPGILQLASSIGQLVFKGFEQP